MTTCLRKSCSFGLLCVSHRRRKVLNIGSVGWGGGGGGAEQGSEYGGGGTFRWLYTDWSPCPQSVPNNYISHIEN